MENPLGKSVRIDKVELTPKGFLKLAVAVAFVLAAIEVGKWLYGKVKGVTTKKTGGELIAV